MYSKNYNVQSKNHYISMIITLYFYVLVFIKLMFFIINMHLCTVV